MPLQIFNEVIPLNYGVFIGNAQGTTIQTLYGSDPSIKRFDAIILSSDDVVDRDVVLWLSIASTFYSIGSITVPAGSGFNGVAPVNALLTLGPANIGGIVFGSFIQFGVSVASTVTAGKTVTVVGLGGVI